MDIIWNEPQAERLICERTLQVETEGALPSPDGRAVKSVLTGNARVAVAEAVSEEGRVRIAGRIEVNVLAQDEEGDPFAFESFAGFTEILPVEEAAAQMNARAVSSVQELSIFPADDGAYMRASVDITVTLTSSVPVKVFGGISGVRDVEYKQTRVVHTRSVACGTASLRLREELPAGGITQVVSVNGSAFVKDFSQSSDGAFVSGVVTLTAAVIGGDGKLTELIKQVPFRERIDAGSAHEYCFCEAKLKRVYLRPLGEEFDLLSMEAEIDFTLRRIEKTELTLPLDAFSPAFPFDCVCEDLRILNELGLHAAQTTIKETLPLPDSAPDMALPLYCSARPIVTDTAAEDGLIKLSGVLVTDLVYESTGGTVNIVGFETPFSMSVDAGGAGMARVTAACSAYAPTCTERAVQMQYGLTVECELYSVDTVRAVVGAEEREREERRSGVAVCFASEGETVFDAAKRYGLPCEAVKAMSPDIEEPFREGDKLILIM